MTVRLVDAVRVERDRLAAGRGGDLELDGADLLRGARCLDNDAAADFHRAARLLEAGEHRLLASLGAEDTGGQDDEREDGGDYDEGDQDDGRLKPRDSTLIHGLTDHALEFAY